MFGMRKRALINLPVRLKHNYCSTEINIIFKVDTGAPSSSLTSKALEKFY